MTYSYDREYAVRMGEPNDRSRIERRGEIAASQVAQDRDRLDFLGWRHDLFGPESGFEAEERRVRELDRRHGSGPTSCAAARAWAAARLEAR